MKVLHLTYDGSELTIFVAHITAINKTNMGKALIYTGHGELWPVEESYDDVLRLIAS